MRPPRPLYVETVVRTHPEALWNATQDPAQHQRWDLRFTRIEHVNERRFRYSTRVLPGLTISGEGTTVRQTRRTSALRFACDSRAALIRSGEGYWRYVPTEDGVRFLTGYDYRPRWGRLGRVADAAFRPLFGWATAWSFDRLRLWLEHGVPPETARRRGIVHAVARVAAVAVVGGIAYGAPGDAPIRVALVATALYAALFTPPPRTVPAARRCRRQPPDRASGTGPAILATLETPR
jgi:hypothetical protein